MKLAGESGREVAGEGPLSRDRKGKGRAVNDSDVFESSDHRRSVEDDGIISPRETGTANAVQASASEIEQKVLENVTPISAQTTNAGDVSSLTDVTLTSTSRRRRTVFDQLQSHLSKATDAKNANHYLQRHALALGNERSERRLHESFQDPVATKPTLLDRLSDSLAIDSHINGGPSAVSHDQDRVESVDHVDTPDHMEFTKSRSITMPVSNQVVHASGQGSKSTRETMLRWLNAANQDGNRDLQNKQHLNGINGVSATVKSPTHTSTASSPSTTPAVSLQGSSDTAQSSSSTLRARLLARLENERRLREDIVSASAAQTTINGATPPHPDDKIDSSNSSSSHSDSVLEVRLRSQALLRARLAMEKKNALHNPGNQLRDQTNETDGRGPSLDLSERELRLKIQLRKARG